MRQRQIRISDIDVERTKDALDNLDPPTINFQNIDGMFDQVDNRLRSALLLAENTLPDDTPDSHISNRWERVERQKDPK